MPQQWTNQQTPTSLLLVISEHLEKHPENKLAVGGWQQEVLKLQGYLSYKRKNCVFCKQKCLNI